MSNQPLPHLMENQTQIAPISGDLSLRESELRYRRLFEAAQDGILILDAATGAIKDVNPFLISLLGYSREEFLQLKLWEVGPFKDVQASQDAFLALQQNEYIRYKDLPLRGKGGQVIQVEFVSNVYVAGDCKVIQCNIRDMTERKQAQDALTKSEARLRGQSVRDDLTGLFNRRYLEETLERELLRAARTRPAAGVIMLDVDNLKGINEGSGHAAGDAVLRALGPLLLGIFRREDIAARYGGDEFTVVMPGAPQEITYRRANHLCEGAIKLNVESEGRAITPIGFSLGVANFPKDGSTGAAVLMAADAALYRAKQDRRQRLDAASEQAGGASGAAGPYRNLILCYSPK